MRSKKVPALSLAALLSSTLLGQERTPSPGDVSTTVRVEVVELDVLALDGKDRPVLDMTKEEFDVRIAGKPQPLEGFDPPAPRVAAASAAAGAPELVGGSTLPVARDGRPPLHVLFIVDLEELPPGAVIAAGTQALTFARSAAGARIGLVTHYGRNEPRLWDDASTDRLETELTAVAESPAATVANVSSVYDPSNRGTVMVERGYEQRQRREEELVQEIVRVESERRADQAMIQKAYQMFGEYLRAERLRVADTVVELRATLERFAVLGDRRHAVLFSRGIERIPGSGAVAFLERARSAAARRPVFGVQPGAVAGRGLADDGPQALGGRLVWDGSPLRELEELADFLASSGVTLHMVDPSSGADASSAAHASIVASRDRGLERFDIQDGASRLVSATGGLMRVNQGTLGAFADTLSASYRLAVRVSGVQPEKTYKVNVISRRKGVHVLARSAFRASKPGPGATAATVGRVEDAVRAAMRDERRTGPARLGPRTIPLKLAWRGKKRGYYELEVKVPYDALGFVPEEDAMVASARITVTPLPLGSATAEPVTDDVFLSFTGAEYSAAQGTDLTRTIKLSLAPGRYQLSVAIEDALLSKSAGLERLTVEASP